MRFITIMFGLILMLGISSCKECTEDDKSPEAFLGPDYWPLYGTWRLVRVSVDQHEYAQGPESGYMNEITWETDGSFVVEWANEVIQVGHIERVVKVSAQDHNSFLITVDLESDCPKKTPWFCGEYTVTAAADSVANIGDMYMTGFSFPWGDLDRRKTLRYDRL